MREKNMDEEHNRESLQNEETEKPIVREAWNTVYSREKRLEELRRKRMAEAQTQIKKADDHRS